MLWCGIAAITLLGASALSAADPIDAFTEPYRTAAIIPSQSGTLESLNVTVGTRVSAGQELGSLDCEVLRVQRKIAQAKADSQSELEAAQAELRVKTSLYERYRALRQDSQEASELEVERKRTDMEIQQAKVRSVEDALTLYGLEVELLEAQIRQRMLLSPIAGQVSAVDAEQGDFVAPGQTKSVVTIVDIDRLRATFHVPGREAARLSQDAEVSLELTETATRVTARVEFVSPITDPRTGTIQVRVVIPNESQAVRSGVRCRLSLGERGDLAPSAVKPSGSTVK